jgi:hypothetical protein
MQDIYVDLDNNEKVRAITALDSTLTNFLAFGILLLNGN